MLPEAVVLGTSNAETGDTSWNLTAIQGKDSEDIQWPGEETLCQSQSFSLRPHLQEALLD